MDIKKIEDVKLEEMVRDTGIEITTIQKAYQAQDHPDAKIAEEETLRDFALCQPHISSALILYHKTRRDSPKEYAVVREIAVRFFKK